MEELAVGELRLREYGEGVRIGFDRSAMDGGKWGLRRATGRVGYG